MASNATLKRYPSILVRLKRHGWGTIHSNNFDNLDLALDEVRRVAKYAEQATANDGKRREVTLIYNILPD